MRFCSGGRSKPRRERRLRPSSKLRHFGAGLYCGFVVLTSHHIPDFQRIMPALLLLAPKLLLMSPPFNHRPRSLAAKPCEGWPYVRLSRMESPQRREQP